ncbi:MAG: hypothetical protein WA865_00640 [Spirulinaceae cyanobacterium]
MNILQKGLIGVSLVALLASCSPDANTKSPATETSKATPAEVRPVKDKTTSAQKDSELLSTIDVKLSDGKVELSESQVKAGPLEFKVHNDTTEPLELAVIKTEVEPTKIMVKEGKIDKTQKGVEVISQLRDRPIKPGQEQTIAETFEPGEYTVVVTSPNQAEPIAYSTLTLQPK